MAVVPRCFPGVPDSLPRSGTISRWTSTTYTERPVPPGIRPPPITSTMRRRTSGLMDGSVVVFVGRAVSVEQSGTRNALGHFA